MTKYVNLNVKNGNIRDVLNQILSSYKYRIEDNKIVLLGEVQQDRQNHRCHFGCIRSGLPERMW